MSNKITGRDFIKMIAPMIGIDSLSGIREIRIKAHYLDVALVEVDMVANNKDVSVTVDPLDQENHTTSTYQVSVVKLS